MKFYNAAATATALGLLLASNTAEAWMGPRGNDTGGIIPWYPGRETMATAREYAKSECAFWGKYAVITSVRRSPGDYIAYRCQFDPPRGRYRRR